MIPDVNSIIEDAKKKGVDMSWLQAPGTQQPGGLPQGQATGGLESISPGASQLMAALQQTQAQKPVYMPFPGGTPTQARRQADTAAEQWGASQQYGQERDILMDERWQKEFEANEAYRNAQLALARAAAGAKSSGTQTDRDRLAYGNYTNVVRNSIDKIFKGDKNAPTMQQILDSIADESPEMKTAGVDPAEVMRYAIGTFQQQQQLRGQYEWMPGEVPPYHSEQKWLQGNMKSIEEMIATMERDYRPAEAAPALEGIMALSPQKKQELAIYMKITPAELEMQIRLDPDRIGAIHARMLEDKARPEEIASGTFPERR